MFPFNFENSIGAQPCDATALALRFLRDSHLDADRLARKGQGLDPLLARAKQCEELSVQLGGGFRPLELAERLYWLRTKYLTAATLVTASAAQRARAATERLREMMSCGQTGSAYEDLIIDAALGLPTEVLLQSESLENVRRFKGESLWVASRPLDLLSSYSLFHDLLGSLRLKPGSWVADLGAGYGRMGYYVGLMHPELNFVGYEIFKPRWQASRAVAYRMGFQKNVKFVEADLGAYDFTKEPADLYFMFNAVTYKTLRIILEKLKALSKSRSYALAVTRNTPIPWQSRLWLREVRQQSGNEPFRIFVPN